jgi:hypothetical protein
MASKKMTDEERYGKVGAAIRRLDPEAYKNRPRSAEGNIKLLKELREKAKETPARQMTPDEFMSVGRGARASDDTPKSTTRGPSTRGGRRASAEETEANNKRIQQIKASKAMERNRATLPSDRATGFRSQAEETGLSAEDRAKAARGYATNIAGAAGAGRLGSMAGSAYRRSPEAFRKSADQASESAGRSLVRKNIPSFSERYRAREAAAARRPESPKRKREDVERMLDEKLASDMAGGFKKGGSVKSSASRRADGIAKKGKTRGKYI